MKEGSIFLLALISILTVCLQGRQQGFETGLRLFYPSQGTARKLNSYSSEPFTIRFNQVFEEQPIALISPLACETRPEKNQNGPASFSIRTYVKHILSDRMEATIETGSALIYSVKASYLIIAKTIWDSQNFYMPIKGHQQKQIKLLSLEQQKQTTIKQIFAFQSPQGSSLHHEYSIAIPLDDKLQLKSYLFTNQILVFEGQHYVFNLTVRQSVHSIEIIYGCSQPLSPNTIFPRYQLILHRSTHGKGQLTFRSVHIGLSTSYRSISSRAIFVGLQAFFLQQSPQQLNFLIRSKENRFEAAASKVYERQAQFTYLVLQLAQQTEKAQSKRLLITCASPTYVTYYLNYWTTWVDPKKTSVQTCQACPTGCYSCAECSSCFRSVNCTQCLSGFNFGKFSFDKYSQWVCTCPSGTYPNATTNTCTSCSAVIPNCASCKSYGSGHYSATCATCKTGYFAVANSGSWGGYTSCAGCTAGCSSCNNEITCLTCGPGLTRTNGACYCPSGLFYSTASSTCTTCSAAVPGCANCAANATTTTCLACNSGFYSSGATCVACASNCNSCTNASCTSCTSPFIVSGNSCVCNATASMFLNTTSNTCLACTSFFSSCSLCLDTNGTISCSACVGGTFLNGSSCVSCPSSCTSCSSLSACDACASNLVVINGSCTCDTSNNSYLNTLTSTCFTCFEIIPQCASCSFNSSSSSVECLGCSAGFFLTNATACASCPITCLNCTDLLTCGGCVAGYELNNVTNLCDCINCTACSSFSLINCSLCDTSGTAFCTQCTVGSYLDNSSNCQPCPIGCATCSSSTVCLSCDSPFLPSNPIGECVCNSLLLSYYNPSTQTCDSCSSIIANCASCATANYVTTCLLCQVNEYIENNTCVTCPFPCTTCNSSSVCTACTPTFLLLNDSCTCDNSSQIFFNAQTNLCSSCTQLTTTLCLSCAVDPSATNSSGIKCVSCSVGFFPDAGTYLCSACPSTCLACSDLATCTECLDTFTLDAGQCACNTTLGYYLFGSKCLPCFSLINYCQQCSNSTGPILCVNCGQGTYLSASNDSCVLCPVNCDICNSTGCTLCSSGYSLSANGVCVCSTTCINFTNADSSCVDCNLFVNVTDNTSTLQCLSCKSKTFVVSNQSCNTCPDSCATCTDFVTCKTCIAGYILVNSNCVCNDYLNEVQVNSTCFPCIQLINGCSACTYSSGVSACTSCIEGWGIENGTCTVCGSGCLYCTVAGGVPNCTVCNDNFTLSLGACTNNTACDNTLGVYYNVNNGSCSNCMDNCQLCYSLSKCVTCKPTFAYLKEKCVCNNGRNYFLDSTLNTCILCQSALDNSSNLYLANCLLCQTSSANYANGVECLDCADGFYLSAGTCLACLSGCQKCTSNTSCCSCSAPAWTMNNGVCICNSAQNYFSDGNSSCLTCNLTNCTVCSNLTTCLMCTLDSYVNASGVCAPTVCANSLVEGIETCDDGNLIDGDGCSSSCQIEAYYFCNNVPPPSVCYFDNRFNIQIQSIAASCNKLTLNFKIYPFYDYYNSASYALFLRSYSLNSSTVTKVTQNNEIVTYELAYTQTIQGVNATFVFEPSALGLNQTSTYPLNQITFAIVPNNNVLAIYYEPQTCDSMESMKKATDAIFYLSYGTLFVSALPCKIVGLQLVGVIQLAFMSLGSMDNVNILMTPMMGMKGINGYSMDLGNDSKKRLLQSSSQYITPERLNSIGYRANFLRNCNAMLILVVSIIFVSIVLYLITYFFKTCAQTLHSISKRLIKEVLLTLILFNCLNFAYSAGIHFRYATSDDSLYLLGTLAATATLIIPVLMAIGLSMSEEDGFGQFKDKFKKGCVEKGYFVVTIIYRMSLGLYMSSSNQDELSTLLVLAFTILFLMYNLVNLPYTKAYHNYRANICHFTQFVCLFVTMYYRSMKSSSSSESVANISSPVYLEYTCIFISLVVSLIVLSYQIYLWVKECMKKKDKERKKVQNLNNASQGDVQDNNKEGYQKPNITQTEHEDKLPQLFSNAYDEYD